MTAVRETKTWKGRSRAGWLSTDGTGCQDTLTLNSEQLIISSRLGTFSFDREEVIQIERAGFAPWLWTGILIRHRKPSYRQYIGFLARGISTGELLQELKNHGYPVA